MPSMSPCFGRNGVATAFISGVGENSLTLGFGPGDGPGRVVGAGCDGEDGVDEVGEDEGVFEGLWRASGGGRRGTSRTPERRASERSERRAVSGKR